jgi:hypothetical protein
LPAPEWTAKDSNGNLAYKWAEQPSGSALRLSLLRIHLSELSAALSTGSYAEGGQGSKSVSKDVILQEYQECLKREKEEAAVSDLAGGRRVNWTRGKAAPL